MGNSKLKVGDKMPDIELLNQHGDKIRLSSSDGQKRIVYFYPKDDTRVCTEQACSFRDWQSELTELGYKVIGISSDRPESHEKFIAGYNLNFQLLSDKGGSVRRAFGAVKLMGLIPARTTYVFDEEGKLVFLYDAMFEGEGHIQQVKQFIKDKTT